ncbi:MAG TPA: type II toxin-antitoxin system VapC family toxin [Mycobacterium sp.]
MTSASFLLDTNIVSDLAHRPNGPVFEHIAEVGEDNVAISVVVACEIRFGLVKRGSRRLTRRMNLILDQLTVLPLEPPVEDHYADIRLGLERAGTPIGPNDLLIAAHARALEMTVVTANAAEFSRVPDLRVVDWT